MAIYIYIYTYICLYIYVYIYIYILYDRQIRDQMMADQSNADLRVKVIPPPPPPPKGGGAVKNAALGQQC